MKFEVSGEPIHTRCLAVELQHAAGDTIHFRGDLLDLRKSGLMELAGVYANAGIIHRMKLEGGFSRATGALEQIDWSQSHIAHEANPATRGECCRDPMVRLRGLVGARLGEGFPLQLKELFGGILGCSHITTLFREISAFVSRLGESRLNGTRNAERGPGERIASRSVFLDGSLSAGVPEVELSVRVADLELDGIDTAGDEVFASLDEVRLVAGVELEGMCLRDLHAGQRTRVASCPEDPVWRSRSGDLEGFAGGSLFGGMARLGLERFGNSPDDATLLSAVLSLSPGMTQVAAALTEAPTRTRASGGSASFPQGGPCYMLRAGGPLVNRLIAGSPPGSEDA